MNFKLTIIFAALAATALVHQGVDAANPGCADSAKKLAPEERLSNTSVYLLDAVWTDDGDRPVKLASLRGQAVVLTMFFTNCQYACPMVINKMQRLQDALPPAARERTRFVLVSLDSQRDTSAALHLYRDRMRIGRDWILLHGEAGDVRELAMVLDVKYEKDSRGQFTHSNLITVLNSSGEIAYQQAGLEGDISADIQAVILAVQYCAAQSG